MDRETILEAIRQMAKENSGKAPGMGAFEKATGIGISTWRGKLWLRWSEAIEEAGFTPNKINVAHDRELLLEHLAALVRKYKRLPTYAETRMARENDKTFPAHHSLTRLGDAQEKARLLRSLAKAREEFSDILAFLPADDAGDSVGKAESAQSSTCDGYVYMMRLGKHYKVGKTFAVPRRHREIALELPQKPEVVHSIHTDDPDGIEQYWHQRFKDKRTNGEWFALDAADIRAFKRRKFM